MRQTNSADIAEVSDLPGRIDATSKPTSKPISAIVADSTIAVTASCRMRQQL